MDPKDYIRRHASRDESSNAASRFGGDHELTVSQKKKSRRGGSGKGAKEAELEAIKWGESDSANSTAWLNLAYAQIQGGRITKETLSNANVGAKFAVLYAHGDNVNDKVRRIIEKVAPGWWNMHDEMCLNSIRQLQDSEDGGPVTEWGSWFVEPGQEHIDEAKSDSQSKCGNGGSSKSKASGKRKAKAAKAKSTAAKHRRKGSGAKGPKKAPKKGPKMTDIESEMVDFMDGFQLVDEDAEEEEIERMAAYANSDKDEPNLNFDFVFNDLEFREMNKKIEEGLSRECF